MTQTQKIKEHAEESLKKFDKIVASYRLSGAGLKPLPELLERANKYLEPRETTSGEFDSEQYLSLIRSGTPRHLAARILGSDPKDVRKRIKFDAAFREAVEIAEEEASEVIEEKLWTIAQNGERWAMELWLKKRHKGRWGDDATVVRHEGTVTTELSAAPIVDQIIAMQALLSQRVELTEGRDIIDVEVEDD